jgi:hypothetical protein
MKMDTVTVGVNTHTAPLQKLNNNSIIKSYTLVKKVWLFQVAKRLKTK